MFWLWKCFLNQMAVKQRICASKLHNLVCPKLEITPMNVCCVRTFFFFSCWSHLPLWKTWTHFATYQTFNLGEMKMLWWVVETFVNFILSSNIAPYWNLTQFIFKTDEFQINCIIFQHNVVLNIAHMFP